MSTPPTDSDLRSQILETSRDMLVSEGYAGLSMRKIATAIGYSATSIYLYFPSKDELVHALIREGFRILSARIYDEVKAGRSTVESLEKMCLAYMRFGLENPGYYEIMFSLHAASMSSYPVVDYREARAMLEVAGRLMQAGREEGVFCIEDATIEANVLWFQLHGAISLILASRTDISLDRDELATASVHSAMRSILRPEPQPEILKI